MPRRGRGGPGHGGGRGAGPGYFRGRGYRMTGPRRLILDVLESADEYMSAEEVYMEVYRQQPGVGIATVYRTLQLLTEMGTAQRLDTGDGKARYKLSPADARRRRVVLICTECSRTVPVMALSDPDHKGIEALEASMRLNRGFTTHSSVTQLFGKCADCLAGGGVARINSQDDSGTTGTAASKDGPNETNGGG